MGLFSCFITFMHLVFWLSLFNLTLAYFTYSMQPLCHDDERSALLKFKESFVVSEFASYDPLAYPKVASWKAEEENGDCCSWDGVNCNENTGHVISLDLSSSCLYGSINSTSTLFHLLHLERLNLADNHFDYSKIPSEIMNLSMLSHLNLSSSFFHGQIPSEILELSKLVSLDLSDDLEHYRYGVLELQKRGLRTLAEKLTNLKLLKLDNVVVSSSIPDILANLSSLSHLSLHNCYLLGEFPTNIFQLPNLSYLNVQYNQNLTGRLPEFKKSSPLKELRLWLTGFSGNIPDSIKNLRSLYHLDISDCFFSGTIPSSLGNLSQLNYLDLSYNDFSGELSSVVENLVSLETLYLSFYNFSSQNSHSLSWISNLKKLVSLDLSGTNLVGEIPSWLRNLTQLTELEMALNQLTGPIPYWLMNLKQLTIIGLGYNQLIGDIPSEIRNLTQLVGLELQSNQLQGPIPSSFYELKNLQYLHLESNNLSGSLDLGMLLHNLKSLEELALSSNNLSLLNTTKVGKHLLVLWDIRLRSCKLIEFPGFLHNVERLRLLDLSYNKIDGQVPRWFLNKGIYSLWYLDLSYNLLTGFEQLPVILPWSGLLTIDLRCNKLQGPLPVPPLSTKFYLVSHNKLTGQLPSLICNLSYIHALDLSYNKLSGMLPQCLSNFKNLSMLNLKSNKFHGSIPRTFVNGTNLRMVDLSHNLLQGKIPRSLASCSMLEFLDLGNNQINDTFPYWLETLQELQVLLLQFNRLWGVIKEPETDFAFPKLRIIDISHNRFTGNLPSKYFQSWNAMKVVNASHLIYMQDKFLKPSGVQENSDNETDVFSSNYDYSFNMSTKGTELEYGKILNTLTAIMFSYNIFEGEIPATIANLRGLRFLSLSDNNLRGCIPSNMSNIKALESLDLSNNILSGQIPQQLADELTFLAFFNVSNNHLTGHIPQGKQFATFENTSFDGNPGLCGKPLSNKCEIFYASEKEDSGSESPFAFGWKVVLVGYASGFIIGVVLGHVFTSRKHEWFVKIFQMQLKITVRKRRQRC